MTIFTLYFIFTKLVGWKEPSEVLNGEVIRRKYPAEKKGTMGGKIRHGDNDVMAPDHITLGCIGTELSAENLEEIAKVVDETEFEGVQMQAVATTEFGPNIVVLMQFRKCCDEVAFRRLDAHFRDTAGFDSSAALVSSSVAPHGDILDSGAARHVEPNKTRFSSLTSCDPVTLLGIHGPASPITKFSELPLSFGTC